MQWARVVEAGMQSSWCEGGAAVMLRRRARRGVDRQKDKEWRAGGHGRQREEARRAGSEAPMRAPATETVRRGGRA